MWVVMSLNLSMTQNHWSLVDYYNAARVIRIVEWDRYVAGGHFTAAQSGLIREFSDRYKLARLTDSFLEMVNQNHCEYLGPNSLKVRPFFGNVFSPQYFDLFYAFCKAQPFSRHEKHERNLVICCSPSIAPCINRFVHVELSCFPRKIRPHVINVLSDSPDSLENALPKPNESGCVLIVETEESTILPDWRTNHRIERVIQKSFWLHLALTPDTINREYLSSIVEKTPCSLIRPPAIAT